LQSSATPFCDTMKSWTMQSSHDRRPDSVRPDLTKWVFAHPIPPNFVSIYYSFTVRRISSVDIINFVTNHEDGDISQPLMTTKRCFQISRTRCHLT
jgi:hypothetical protein